MHVSIHLYIHTSKLPLIYPISHSPYIHTSKHPFIHYLPSTHIYIHLSIQSCMHPSVYVHIYKLPRNHSVIHLSIHVHIHLSIRACMHVSIPHSHTYPYMYPTIHPCTHPPPPCIHPNSCDSHIYPSIHLPIHPFKTYSPIPFSTSLSSPSACGLVQSHHLKLQPPAGFFSQRLRLETHTATLRCKCHGRRERCLL